VSAELKSLDKWEKAREEAKEKLVECQKEKGFKSCMECSEIVGCETRNDYVKKVYESMSKGKGGGFEF